MNMKLCITTIVATGLLGLSNAYASSATIPNTFVAGEPAVAADVNENFTTLETAINDNDSRITALEATPDPVTSFVSIPAHGMRGHRAGCGWTTIAGSTTGEFNSADTTVAFCDVVAAANLPHDATLESLTCTVFDNDGETDGLRGALRRAPLDGSSNTPDTLFSTSESIDSVDPSTLTDTTISASFETVDNENYAYFLSVDFPNNTDTVGSNLQVYACTISYTE